MGGDWSRQAAATPVKHGNETAKSHPMCHNRISWIPNMDKEKAADTSVAQKRHNSGNL
jgi:hypothetical protein